MPLNPFELRDRINFIRKTAEVSAPEIIMELETQAEFEFDLQYKDINAPDEVRNYLKKIFVSGATFGMTKTLEKLMER